MVEHTSHIHLPGRRKILITAPHTEEHKRQGQAKHAEPKTGLIARFLSENYNCHALITDGLQEHDPNFDEICPLTESNCPFKDKVSSIIEARDIRLVIDLHQLRPERPFSFVIGTNDGKTVHEREFIVPLLQKHLLQVDDDKKNCLVNPVFGYSARHTGTVTRYVAESHAIAAMQLEINSQITDNWEQVAVALGKFVIELAPLNRRGRI